MLTDMLRDEMGFSGLMRQGSCSPVGVFKELPIYTNPPDMPIPCKTSFLSGVIQRPGPATDMRAEGLTAVCGGVVCGVRAVFTGCPFFGVGRKVFTEVERID